MPRDQRTSRSEEGQKKIGSNQTAESRGVRLSVTALVALVGAVLAAAISATSLTFALVPGLKPDPKERVGADLAVLTLDKNIDYGQYLDRPGRTVKKTEERPRDDHPGNVFYIRVHIEGFKRESVQLKWFTYNHGERLPSSRRGATERAIFEPHAPINTQVAQIWVREPGHFDEDGYWDSEASDFPYFVRFELYSGEVLLAFKDSPKFYVG